MTLDEFRQVLTTFADRPADIDIDRGELLVAVRDEVIEAGLSLQGGDLFVTEQNMTISAPRWIVERVARLPLLADRLLTQIPPEPFFIGPAGKLTDRLERAPKDDEETDVLDVTAHLLDLLDEQRAGTATGLYLTSDAGEGKTTLIRHLAHVQAQRYKRKEKDWLLVPISLGGRTLLRFDDVITGTLTNTLRFPFLYYEAFVKLVKMGFVVPALDGFEEMFVESPAGDARSAIGSLMNMLDSSGRALIAARRAYFEYKSLQASAPLYESFGDRSVEFVRLALQRWDRDRFISYGSRRGVDDSEALFDEVAERFGDAHPLLTRPMLVERLMGVAEDSVVRREFIAAIDTHTEGFFRDFVRSILFRESNKWVDKVSDPPRPLLSVEQHHELLSQIALEMWRNESAVLNAEILDLVAELYADSAHMEPGGAMQLRERIKQHAFIATADGHFQFDHDEFYHYFLGIGVAWQVVNADMTGIVSALRVARLPDLAVDTATRCVLEHGNLSSAMESLNAACADHSYASFVRENAGSLAIGLLHTDSPNEKGARMSVHRMTFLVDSLESREIHNVEFHDCHFLRTGLSGSVLRNCLFERCEFGQLDVSGDPQVKCTTMRDCTCHSVSRSGENAVFNPEAIAAVLRYAGFDVTRSGPEVTAFDYVPADPVKEERLVITERVCRTFLRATRVNENTLRQRLRGQASAFFNGVLPSLQERGVVIEVPYHGKGRQRRYRLGVPFGDVVESIECADGAFDRFLERFSN